MELGLRQPSKRSSDELNDAFVVNATFVSRSTESAKDSTRQAFHGRASSASRSSGEQSFNTTPEPGFFRNGHQTSQLDPKAVASRPSDQMMQDQRLLGHQVLYRDRVFSDSGMNPAHVFTYSPSAVTTPLQPCPLHKGILKLKGSPGKCMRPVHLQLKRPMPVADWQAHCSYKRYLPEPIVMLRVLAAQAYPLAIVIVITGGCAIYEKAIRKSDWVSLQNLEASFAYSLCSFALSLLLIFKTNSSYSRFWEARSAWGYAYTCCRAFIAKIQAYAPDMPMSTRKLILRWLIVLPYAMRTHLVDYKPGSDSLQELLPEEEVQWLRSTPEGCAPHHPIKAVNVLLAALADSCVTDILKMDLANNLERYLAQCGICERISRTPIPMPYTRHTTRFIILYTSIMPLLLWRHFEWWTFFVASLITMLLAGIDNIGIMIENPMRILPMSAYCFTIHQNILLSGEAWVSSERQTIDPLEKVPRAYRVSLSNRQLHVPGDA